RPRTRLRCAALVPPDERIPQDAHAAATIQRGRQTARRDARPRRLFVSREVLKPPFLDSFHLGRRAGADGVRQPGSAPNDDGPASTHMAETAFTRWTIRGSEVPPSWDDAIRRSEVATTK